MYIAVKLPRASGKMRERERAREKKCDKRERGRIIRNQKIKKTTQGRSVRNMCLIRFLKYPGQTVHRRPNNGTGPVA